MAGFEIGGGSKRKVLIVEDNELNRELLRSFLEDDYELLEAENGEVGLRVLSEYYQELSIVILDVFMPVMDGFRFLEKQQADPLLSGVPVIVATASKKDEVRCLQMGASDFIPKPYEPAVVLARMNSVIKLRESVATLSVVEFDDKTGLYTRQAFYHHAERALADHPDVEFSIVVGDVKGFKLINDAYGEKVGDDLIRYLAENAKLQSGTNLIARDLDIFFFMLPTSGLSAVMRSRSELRSMMREAPVHNVTVKFGVYRNVDRTQPISVLCDRAMMAVESVKNDFTTNVGYYDSEIKEKRLRAQRMEADFDRALENGEFRAWFQPKVDVETQQIAGAEALVRWIDEKGRMVSPGEFIPLFERDGLISRLDEYIFQRVCAFQRMQLDSGESVVPISVNLSRNSLYSGSIGDRYSAIVRQYGIPMKLVPIEITESATTDRSRVTELCKELVDAGFQLHMDDFGAGYSSMLALGTMPFDVLKLDKSLVDQIGTVKGEIILKHTISIAQNLGMKVVAEGVEQIEQVRYLDSVGCDMIQGFYYSPPKNEDVFRAMLRDGLSAVIPAREWRGTKTEPEQTVRRDELKTLLSAYRRVFPIVRVVSEDCHRYSLSNEDGELEVMYEHCFDAWRRGKVCDNCIAAAALKSNSTARKFEVLDGDIYLATAKYIVMDGEPYVIEMLDKVSADMLNGYSSDPIFLKALTDLDRRLYEDSMLGIHNRRYYEEQVSKLEYITAVTMVDVDNFKSINDTYGHHVGDKALKAVVAAIRRSVRADDVLVRYGGDEILVLFKHMQPDYLEKRLHAIHESITGIILEEYPELRVSASIGACTCKGYNEEALRAADAAMYRAKESASGVEICRMEGHR